MLVGSGDFRNHQLVITAASGACTDIEEFAIVVLLGGPKREAVRPGALDELRSRDTRR